MTASVTVAVECWSKPSLTTSQYRTSLLAMKHNGVSTPRSPSKCTCGNPNDLDLEWHAPTCALKQRSNAPVNPPQWVGLEGAFGISFFILSLLASEPWMCFSFGFVGGFAFTIGLLRVRELHLKKKG